MNHRELVVKAGWWLRERKRCLPTLMEPCYGNSSEQPDAIGWRQDRTLMVECKATRSDLLSDKSKRHRQEYGVGNLRWFMAPVGVFRPEDAMAEWAHGWGFLEVRGKLGRVHILREPTPRETVGFARTDECRLLRGALANVQLRDRGYDVGVGRHQDANLGRDWRAYRWLVRGVEMLTEFGELVERHDVDRQVERVKGHYRKLPESYRRV